MKLFPTLLMAFVVFGGICVTKAFLVAGIMLSTTIGFWSFLFVIGALVSMSVTLWLTEIVSDL